MTIHLNRSAPHPSIPNSLTMGNFECYGFAGTFFIVFAIWYLIQICRRYHHSRRRGAKYNSSTYYLCESPCGLCRDHPIETYVKTSILVAGISLEIVLGMKDGWNAAGLKHAKFATIYFFFAISSLVDMCTHYLHFKSFSLDYLCSLFSFFVEWILFRFPGGDRPPLEELLYKLLEYVIFLTIAAVAMEMQCRSHTIPAIIKSYLMLLQGTWLWQCAFVLWKPSFGLPWKHDDEGDLILASLFFAWHCGGNIILVLAISGGVTFAYKGKGLLLQRKKDEVQMKSLIKPKKNGQTIISLGSYDDDDDDDDDESDIEFQRRRRQ